MLFSKSKRADVEIAKESENLKGGTSLCGLWTVEDGEFLMSREAKKILYLAVY